MVAANSIKGENPFLVETTTTADARSTSVPSGYTVITEKYTYTVPYGFGTDFTISGVSTTVVTRQMTQTTASAAAYTSVCDSDFDCPLALSSLISDNASASRSRSLAAAASQSHASAQSAGALSGQSGSNSSHNSSNGISGGAIAAAVIVPIVVIAALIAGVFFFLRRRKQKKKRISGASTIQSFHNQPSPDMAMAAGNRESLGPPTLNHIVPGTLATANPDLDTEAAQREAPRRSSGVRRGPSAFVRKPVAQDNRSSMPQLGEDILPPVSPMDDMPPVQSDPFATPTGGSVANSPEDGPNYLHAAALSSAGQARPRGPAAARDELFITPPSSISGAGTALPPSRTNTNLSSITDPIAQPHTTATNPNITTGTARQWHSGAANSTSRFHGRDPRNATFETERPMSPATAAATDDGSDEEEGEEEAEIGQATMAAPVHRQRASVIDMERVHAVNGSAPSSS